MSGRLDYIETIGQWNRRIGAPSLRKTLFKLQLLPRWLTSSDFRLAFTSGVSANKVYFERELLEHYRLVFQKQRREEAWGPRGAAGEVQPVETRSRPAAPSLVAPAVMASLI